MTKRTTKSTTVELPVRGCDVCGHEDTDPRHVHALDDGGTQMRHMDCCREAGCPDGTCDAITETDLRGDELRTYLTGSD